MAEQPKSRLPVRDFLGLVTNEDSHDLAPGQMQVQRNLQIFSKGQASVRKGMVGVTFDNGISPTVNAIQSLTYFRIPGADLIVYQDSGGNVKVGRNPGTPGIVTGPLTLITTPAAVVDFIQWLVDGGQRLITPTFTLAPPYRQIFDTTTASNGLHEIQPVAYTGPYRGLNPTSISGLKCWVDFTDAANYTLTTGHITSVNDKSGTVPAFTAGTGPALNLNSLNGLSGASFGGVNSHVLKSTTNSASIFGATAGDVFIVANIPNVSTLLFGGAATASSTNYFEFEVQDSQLEFSLSYASGTTRTPTGNTIAGLNVPFIANFRSSSSVYDFWFNGVQGSVGGTGTDGKWLSQLISPANLTIGGLIYGSGPTTLAATAIIYEILMFNVELSAANRLIVETYLAEKYGVPMPSSSQVLFGGVPYANIIPYTIVDDTPYNIFVGNPTGLTLPVIKRKLNHISIYHHKYSLTLNAVDQALCVSSIDELLLSDPTVPPVLQAEGVGSPIEKYVCITQWPWYQAVDWANWADANGYYRELAFFHVLAETSGLATSFGSQGVPPRWWMDAQQEHAGVLTPLWNTVVGHGRLDGSPTYLTDGHTGATFGGVFGDAIWTGYNEKFDRWDVRITTGASSGWTGELEYVSAVRADGTPAAWSPMTIGNGFLVSDGTSGMTTTGVIQFNPFPTPAWVPCNAIPGGSGMLSYPDAVSPPPTGMKGYYLRMKTTVTGTAPVVSAIYAYDYTSQGDTAIGTVPAYDTASEVPGIVGYLPPAAYSGRASGKDAYFSYQSRLITPFGNLDFFSNFAQASTRAWVVQYLERVLADYPQYDGFFLDNSAGGSFVATVEDQSTYRQYHAMLLNALARDLRPGPSGQLVLTPNMGTGGGDSQIQNAYPRGWYETFIQETDGWFRFNQQVSIVNTVATDFSPPPTQILDTFYTAGDSTHAPTDRVRLQELACYYMLARPETKIEPFGGNAGAFNVDTLPNDGNFIPNRWIGALLIDIGQPTGPFSIVDGPTADPDDGSKTYYVYARDHDNAYVLYKPLSDNGAGTAVGDPTGTPTPITLPVGNYRQLNADGTPGGTVSSTVDVPGIVNLQNGQGMILMKV